MSAAHIKFGKYWWCESRKAVGNLMGLSDAVDDACVSRVSLGRWSDRGGTSEIVPLKRGNLTCV